MCVVCGNDHRKWLGGERMSYKWASPYDWLADTARGWSKDVLYAELMSLALKAGSDDLQDKFQDKMDEDGYFEETSE